MELHESMLSRACGGLGTALLLLSLTACGGGSPPADTTVVNGGGTGTPAGNNDTGTGNSGSGTPPASATYQLAWDAVADPSVTGYRAYYATAPLNSGKILDSIETTGTTLDFVPADHGITAGATLYMAVSALGANGLESPVSEPVSILVE